MGKNQRTLLARCKEKKLLSAEFSALAH